MTAVGQAITAPEITVNGTLLAQRSMDLVVGLRIQKSLCLIGRATLRLSDPDYALSASVAFPLGAAVAFGVPSDPSGLFTGVVTGVSLEQRSTTPELVVTIDDAGYQLALGTRVRTYLQVTFADALRQVAGFNALKFDGQSKNMSTVHDYLLQSGSDLAFLNALCQRSGSVWWVDDQTLTVRDVGDEGRKPLDVALTEQLIEFSVRATAMRPTKVAVNGWDAKAQNDVVGKSGPAVKTADSTFVSNYVGESPKLHDSTQSTYELNPKNAGEANVLAAALYNDLASSAVIAKGRGQVNPAVLLMTKLNVTRAGPASGSYVVSQLEHVYRRDGFYTSFVAGPIRPGALVDTLGPEAPDPGFEIGSLLTAVVTNLEDPDKVGRVKVKYSASGGLIESAWARVVGLGVGKSRGSVFQPEIGDEVLIGFERGDPRYPVVIGGLFSAVNSLPQNTGPAGNKVNVRTITSRLGHVIEMADGTGPAEQHLLLKLAGDKHKLRLGADRFDIEVAAGKPIKIMAGKAKFEIDAQGNVVIEGTKITLKAETQVSVEGSAGVEVKSNAKVAVQAALVDVKANGMATVDGGGALTLKGGQVMIN